MAVTSAGAVRDRGESPAERGFVKAGARGWTRRTWIWLEAYTGAAVGAQGG